MRGGAEEQRILSDALELPFRDDSMDAVLMVAVFHHFSTEERRARSLREIERVLKPGVQGMVTVWSYEHLSDVYKSQDILLDFTLPKHRSKQQDKDRVYKRYYHLFRKEEI